MGCGYSVYYLWDVQDMFIHNAFLISSQEQGSRIKMV
jgi:hypothetical protein